MAGIYCADIYCDDCIDDIKNRIASEVYNGNDDSGMLEFIYKTSCDGIMEVSDFRDQLDEASEQDYDSDQYPKYCGDDEESDVPQHCGSHADCLNPTVLSDGSKVGHFFGNALTSEGAEYVKEAVDDALVAGRNGPAVELWMPHYDYIDYIEPCVTCGNYAEIDDCEQCEDCAADEPCDEDFTITPCGPLGGKSALGRVEGKFVGEFYSDDSAIIAAKQIMEDEQFWPDIWIVSDHGNWELLSE